MLNTSRGRDVLGAKRPGGGRTKSRNVQLPSALLARPQPLVTSLQLAEAWPHSEKKEEEIYYSIVCALVGSVALLVACRTNDRKVAGSRPTKVVCITVLTDNRLGWTVRCGQPPLLLPSCRKLEFRLSALMDSDLAWVIGKSGRQSWC